MELRRCVPAIRIAFSQVSATGSSFKVYAASDFTARRNFLLQQRQLSVRDVGTSTRTSAEFSDVFAAKTNRELIRSILVLKFSSMDLLVKYSEQIMVLGRQLLWKPAFKSIMKSTFYGQFAAGDSVAEVKATAVKLRQAGISSMLCIPIETSAAHSSLTSEEIFDRNFTLVRDCISATAEVQDKGFSQVKVTALSDPRLLLMMNKSLSKFETDHKEPGSWSVQAMAGLLERGDYQAISVTDLSPELNAKLANTFKRLDRLAQHCMERGVYMMIDAEQSYIQAALGYLVLVLQAKYNKGRPVVFNTYQCYRKDTLARVRADHALGQQLGFQIASKLVRGAYMAEERRLAVQHGYEDPINENKEKTTAMFHSVVDFFLPWIAGKNGGLMIASHNEETVNYVKRRMRLQEIEKSQPTMSFAQLFGMCDHVSYSLGKEGYSVFKSLPYGSIDDTLLYLSRRAHENRSVAERTKFERKLMWNELSKRARSRIFGIAGI